MKPSIFRIPKFYCWGEGGFGGLGENDPSAGKSNSATGYGGFGGLGIGNPGSYGGQQSVGAPGATGGASASAQSSGHDITVDPETGKSYDVTDPSNPVEVSPGVAGYDGRSISQKVDDYLSNVNWGKVGKYTALVASVLSPLLGPVSAGILGATGMMGSLTQAAANYGGAKDKSTGRAEAGQGGGLLEPVSIDKEPAKAKTYNYVPDSRSIVPALPSFMKAPTWQSNFQDGLLSKRT